MTQSVAHTLRSSAKEAEFYITRHGRMKTASGSLAITSGRYRDGQKCFDSRLVISYHML